MLNQQQHLDRSDAPCPAKCTAHVSFPRRRLVLGACARHERPRLACVGEPLCNGGTYPILLLLLLRAPLVGPFTSNRESTLMAPSCVATPPRPPPYGMQRSIAGGSLPRHRTGSGRGRCALGVYLELYFHKGRYRSSDTHCSYWPSSASGLQNAQLGNEMK
jgi:hypothetical protein